MFFLKWITTLLLFLLAVNQTRAQDVDVKNVTFTQRNEAIIIKYDLDGIPNKKYHVNISLSDDYGVSFRIRPKSVRGDVGQNVTSGQGKEIVWDMTKDFPNGISQEGFVFAVDAKLQKSNKAIYYLLGGGVAVGVTYFLLSKPKKGSVSITIPGEI